MNEIVTWTAEELTTRFLNVVFNYGKDKRQRHYFEQFLKSYPQEIQSGEETNTLDVLFQKIEASDEMKEMLFEVYRKVCLSVSKKLGPKTMAILSSKLCHEDRVANEVEELIFEACENLNDIELRSIVKFWENIEWGQGMKHGRIPKDHISEMMSGNKYVVKGFLSITEQKYEYLIELSRVSIQEKIDYAEVISKPSLEEYLGRWAVKLRNLDVLLEHTKEEYKYERDEHCLSETTKSFSASINKEFLRTFVQLINRATGPTS